MPFSTPTGFMAPPLPGVFVAVSCSGTLEQGSPFHVRAHSNYFVVVAIWTFVVCAIYTCRVIGVRCCKAWAIHPVFKNMSFSFQILVLSYELSISLAFFSHYPGDERGHLSLTASRGRSPSVPWVSSPWWLVEESPPTIPWTKWWNV